MLDKYYVPSIEEFHIGFECEYSHEPDVEGWTKTEIELKDFTGFYPLVGDLQGLLYCRVKYLDSDDIESCGFRKATYKTFGKIPYIKYEKLLDNKFVQLLHYQDDNLLEIFIEPYVGEIDNITGYLARMEFRGIINNKSELKKLLKQLGIC